ncbi:MAG: helix-turn-helix domain-containing protein [Promethearchaeota archaeon]
MIHDIVQINLNIHVPKDKWLAQLNKKYSELTFQLMSKFLLNDNIGMTLFHIKGPTIKRFMEDFKKNKRDIVYQILFEEEDYAILNIKTEDPWILSALVKTELLINYPIVIKEGKIKFIALSNRQKVDNFLAELDKKKIKYSLKSIGHYQHISLLTERQQTILSLALKNGYYNIPRTISLSKFAQKLNISPSALSEMLRRINKKLANFYFESVS